MTSEIEKLIQKSLIRSIQIKLLEAKQEGMIISEDIINTILRDLEVE